MRLVSASARDISSSNTINTAEIRIRSGSSFLTVVFFLTRIGWIMAAMPTSNNILIILLPMTLPISISVLPEIKELMDTASSGALVPKARIVRPIRSFETLKWEAVLDAPSISKSAPLMSKTKPTISSNICSTISI